VTQPPPTPATPAPVCARCGAQGRQGARFCRSCGAELPAAVLGDGQNLPAPAPATQETSAAGIAARPGSGEPAADARPRAVAPALSRRSVRRRTIVLAGIAVLVVLVSGVVFMVQNVVYSPTKPVTELFDALARRDTAAAAKLVGSHSSPFLAGHALTSKGYQPPTDAHVKAVSYRAADKKTRRKGTNYAYVQATYKLGGRRYASVMVVEREGGLFTPYGILDGAVTQIHVVDKTYIKRASVAGIAVAAVPADGVDAADQYGADPVVLPGVYHVTPDASDPLLTFAPYDAAIPGRSMDDSIMIKPKLTVRQAAVDAARQQVKDKIDKCATSTALSPDGCPFEDPNFFYPSPKVHWSISSYPVIDLRLDSDTVDDGARVEVHTAKAGTATATYTAPYEHKKTTDTVKIEPTGVVVYSHGKYVWDDSLRADLN
jgi:hypothetical protein